MKELTLYFDFCDWIGIDLKEYLLTQKGIKEVTINTEENYVTIKYDSKQTSNDIIKYEILFCVDSLRIPSIVAFDKHEIKVKKYTLNIKDICCEFCFKGIIEELLTIPGINSAFSDFNYNDMFDVKIEITYQSEIISTEEIRKLEKKMNNY